VFGVMDDLKAYRVPVRSAWASSRMYCETRNMNQLSVRRNPVFFRIALL